MSCGRVPLPTPHKSSKRNASSNRQSAHDTTVRCKKRESGSTHAVQSQKACALMHPLQGASFLSTPLQGGILKPPALRVVADLSFAARAWPPRRGGHPLPMVFLLQLSPKVGKNRFVADRRLIIWRHTFEPIS